MITSVDLVLNEILKSSLEKRYISGQEIAEYLGISRSAVNKAVMRLRENGYSVEAVNNKGYILEKPSNRIGYGELMIRLPEKRLEDFYIYDSVTSTNVVLHALAESGAKTGSVVIAKKQTAGRGRNGSRFESPSDKGIYMSYLIKPKKRISLKGITPAAAKAVAASIRNILKEKGNVKVENCGDVILNGTKICGILTEVLFEAESGYVRYAMLGIGIRQIRGVNRSELVSEIVEKLDKEWL